MKSIAFLDTSVVLRHILGEIGAVDHLHTFEKLFASELLRIEVLRAIDRLRLDRQTKEAETSLRLQLMISTLARVEEIPLQQPIVRRAGETFSVAIGTLDALHLATAMLLQEQLERPLLFLTHDRRQGVAAQAAGFQVDGY